MCIPAAPAGWSSRRAGHDRPACPMTATLVPVRVEPISPRGRDALGDLPGSVRRLSLSLATPSPAAGPRSRPRAGCARAAWRGCSRHGRRPPSDTPRRDHRCRPQHPRTTVTTRPRARARVRSACGPRRSPTAARPRGPRYRRGERARQVVSGVPVVGQVGGGRRFSAGELRMSRQRRRRTPRAAGCARRAAAPDRRPRATARGGTRRRPRPPAPAGAARRPRAAPRSRSVSGSCRPPPAAARARAAPPAATTRSTSCAAALRLSMRTSRMSRSIGGTRARRLRPRAVTSSSAKNALPSRALEHRLHERPLRPGAQEPFRCSASSAR